MSFGRVGNTSCTTRGRGLWMLCQTSLASAALALMVTGGSVEAQSYRFSRIQVEGNARIQTSTIATYTGIEAGKSVSGGDLNDAYQRVLGSGLFEKVEIVPRGGTLLVRVTEYPMINRISIEGNRRVKDEALEKLIKSKSRRVFNPTQAEEDANEMAKLYSVQGRVAATVTPRIIRRSDNRVDLVFEVAEGATSEVERVSFVGNRAYSDRRLRRVLETKQAGILRALINKDTVVEERVEFDKQVLRDFYLSRGYIDFRVLGTNIEFTRERDAFFMAVNVEEGQQFTFGNITTVSEIPEADAAEFQAALRIKPGVVYSPALVENSIARMERLAIQKGIDFLRVDPRITRDERNLALNVEFALVRGPRVFVERIDIEGNTTTLDRVVRQQFKVAEGDPFNPREIRESAERIRALGFFETAEVDARQGSAQDQVVVDVNVEEKPTGSLSLGGSYSASNGFGLAIGLRENNFLGRGQQVGLSISSATNSEEYTLSFVEPHLLGRDLKFGLSLGTTGTDSSYATFDTKRDFFDPYIEFPLSERGTLQLRYSFSNARMEARDNVTSGVVISREIGFGDRTTNLVGFQYSWDSRVGGLNPNAGLYFETGADFGLSGGDNEFVRSHAKAIAQTKILNEEVTLRATVEAGVLSWRGSNTSRTIDRYILSPDVLRGFEPNGVGPRDLSGGKSDAIGGNKYFVARFEAEFPLGLPEEIGLRGGVFYDVGNLWDLRNVDTSGTAPGEIVGGNGSLRHVIGLSFLWNTGFGPLRFNFSNALKKEAFDKERTFDVTLQANF
ncbi:MAG: outer membrane protein assembly factor BamA [Pseudooceanicola sp.]|nr:outer membrane protein assembly factor BamA [Pseudooceanicola sp.]